MYWYTERHLDGEVRVCRLEDCSKAKEEDGIVSQRRFIYLEDALNYKRIRSSESGANTGCSDDASNDASTISTSTGVVANKYMATTSSVSSTVVASKAQKRPASDSVASIYNKKPRLLKFGHIDWSHAPIVYTDGACSDNGRNGAKAGYGVYWGDNSPDNEFGPVYGEPTNNRGELLALKMAVRKAVEKELRALIIRTDSQLTMKSFDEWMPNWKKNNWMTVKNEFVKNKDLLVEIDELLGKIHVKFRYVENNPCNVAATARARKGALKSL